MELNGRIINFRSFLFIAVSVIVAILGMRLYYISRLLGFLTLALLIGVLFGAGVFYARCGAPVYKRATFIFAMVFSAIAAVNFFITIQSVNYLDDKTIYMVSGQTDAVDFENGSIVLKNIVVDGTPEKGKIRLSVDFASYSELYALRIGDKLIFESVLYPNPIMREDRSINAYAFRSDIRYRSYEFLSESGTVILEKSEPDLIQKIKVDIHDTLVFAMGTEHGGVAYGMFSGDTSGITEELADAYSVSGMAHTLSVSGLHIAYLCAAILAILKLLRVKRLPASLSAIAILWMYLLFTGFVPAALRAVIMATVMLTTRIFSRRYDSLNALGIAVTVILTVFPIYIFDAGFQLSVTAVLGIILFAKRITNMLLKIRIPNYIAQTFGVTVSSQIGFLPAMIFGFHSISTYALLFNMLLLPIIGIAFSVMFLGLILTAILRPLIVILRVVGLAISFVDTLILSAAKLPYAVIYVVPIFGAVIFMCCILYFIASRFVLRPKGKCKVLNRVVALCLSAVLCLSGIFTVPRLQTESYLVPVDSFGEVTTIVHHDGKTYLVGDVKNFYAIDRALTVLQLNCVDAIFLSELSLEAARVIVRFSYSYRAGKIFAYEGGDLSGLGLLAESGIYTFYTFDGSVTLANNLAPIVESGRHLGYELFTEGGSIALCGYRTSYNKLPPRIIDRTYAIRCFMYQDLYPDRIFFTNMKRGFQSMEIPQYQYTLQDNSHFAFDFSSGKLYALST